MKIRPSVQAVIFDEDTKKLLLIEKFDLIKKENVWRLVKGGVEEGETEQQALKREIFEEVGLKNIQILDKIYSYKYTWRNLIHIVSVYLIKASMSEKVILQTDTKLETPIVDFAWVSKEQAIKMLFWKDEKEAVKLLK